MRGRAAPPSAGWRDGSRPDRARLRERREGAGGPRAGGGARARAAAGARSGDLAGRSGASAETLGRLAWAGACDALVDGAVEARRRRALWKLGVAVPGIRWPEGTQLALPLEPHEGPELRALSRLGADAGRLRLDRRDAARAPARADAARRCPPTSARARELETPPARPPRARGRPRGRAPAPGHREGRHVHAARGRARHDQPDRAAAGPRALPAGGARRAAGAGRRPARAPRGHDQRRSSTGSSASSAPTCRAPRSSTSSRAGCGRATPAS